MSDVRTNNIPVPRTARNKRIYSGNTGISKTVISGGGGGGETVLDWVGVSTTDVVINRNLTVEGDLTVQNLSGLAGDTVIVNENGTLATVREVINEVPAGLINGVNAEYTLAHLPDGLIKLYKNGQKIKLGLDYTILGQTISLIKIVDGITSPNPLISDGYEDVLLCDYRYVTYSPGGTPVPAIPDQVNWVAMTRGVAAQSSGFDIQICRIGKTLQISGYFLSASNPAVGSVIASIAISSIAEGMSLTRPQWITSNEISSDYDNRGIRFYVDTFDPTIKPTVRLLCDYEFDAGQIYFSKTLICL